MHDLCTILGAMFVIFDALTKMSRRRFFDLYTRLEIHNRYIAPYRERIYYERDMAYIKN